MIRVPASASRVARYAARVGAAVEVVTFVMDGSERAIVAPVTASSPGIVTLARSAAG